MYLGNLILEFNDYLPPAKFLIPVVTEWTHLNIELNGAVANPNIPWDTPFVIWPHPTPYSLILYAGIVTTPATPVPNSNKRPLPPFNKPLPIVWGLSKLDSDYW